MHRFLITLLLLFVLFPFAKAQTPIRATAQIVKAQTGTSYAIVGSDAGKLITLSNASSVTVSIAQAGTAGFPTGWVVEVRNLGAGTVTITPTTSTIGGAATRTLATGQGVRIHSNGTNYILSHLDISDSERAAIGASGGGDMFKADNLSGLVSNTTARSNLGVAIGTDVEGYDADLNDIAGISPTNDDVIQRKASHWTNRTMVQLKADLALVKGDVGLGNADNTSDVNKPVSTAQQTAIDGKVSDTAYDAAGWNAVTAVAPSKNAVRDKIETLLSANTPITGATKTKITYDLNGLVTGGTDATTADIADSTNKRYVTDAQQTVLGNTSGANTGDQTNISGNAATVTTNANLTGPITSSGNATAVASQTGTGSKFVMDSSPAILTPTIADFSNAGHTHANAAGGGQLDNTAIKSANQAGSGTKFSMTSALGVSGNCAQWAASGLGDTGSPCGGAAGGGIAGYSGSALSFTGIQYFPPIGGGLPSGTEASVDAESPSAGTITNFYAVLSAAPGVGNSVAVTFRDAGSDTSVTCTIAGASATDCRDVTHSFAPVAQDKLSVKAVTTGTIVGTLSLQFTYQYGTTGSNGTVNAGTATHLGYYAGTGTAISDVGSDFTFDGSHTLAMGANGLFDLSAASGAAAFKVPVAAGAAPIANGTIAYDSTANDLEYGDNGTNRKVANLDEAQTFTNKTLTAPILTTPDLGTPSALVGTNITGTAASLTAGNATKLATARALNGTNFDGSAAITITTPYFYASNCTTDSNCSTQANTGGTGGNQDTASGTSGTSELIFKSQGSLPANYLITNKVVRVCGSFQYTSSGAVPAATWALKLGGVNIWSIPAAGGLYNNSMTSRTFSVCWMVQGTAAAGASVSVIASTMGGGQLNSGPAILGNIAQPVAGIATNGVLSVAISHTWAASTAGNNIILLALTVEGLN